MMKIEFNVFDVPPSKLRALAHFLNCLASDEDGGAQVKAVAAQITAPAPAAGNDAPTVSTAPVADTISEPSTPAAPSAQSELDANGLPWDARIHSSSKNQNADGTWRYLRGGDVDQRAAVEAELRAAGYGQVTEAQTPPPPPPVTQAANEPTPPPPAPPVPAPAADVPPPPPPPVAAAPAADADGHEVTTAMVFKRASSMSKEQQAQALELVGLTAMGDFLKKQKDDPAIVQAMWDAMVAITGEE